VARCANEMARAAMYWRAVHALGRAEYDDGVHFIRLARLAMFDQMFAHVIKVLSIQAEEKGLWYLINQRKHFVQNLLPEHRCLIKPLRKMAENRLRLIRNKTHFHLDERRVLDAPGVWKEAAIYWGELAETIDASLQLLCLLHKEIRGQDYDIPYYDSSDATRVAEHADKHGLLSTGKPADPALAALFDS
jgi:hypothetical protein